MKDDARHATTQPHGRKWIQSKSKLQALGHRRIVLRTHKADPQSAVAIVALRVHSVPQQIPAGENDVISSPGSKRSGVTGIGLCRTLVDLRRNTKT